MSECKLLTKKLIKTIRYMQENTTNEINMQQQQQTTTCLSQKKHCFLLILSCRCIRSRHNSRYLTCCMLKSFITSMNLVRSVSCCHMQTYNVTVASSHCERSISVTKITVNCQLFDGHTQTWHRVWRMWQTWIGVLCKSRCGDRLAV